MIFKFSCLYALLLLLCLLVSCSKAGTIDPRVHQLGDTEVTARLIEIPGKFPPNDLYDYAYVMKYEVLQVHRGEVAEKTVLVGHYNPLKPRATVADDKSGDIGGNVVAFNVGDIHRMALQAPLEEQFMGGIVNEYFVEGKEQKIYWALWTDSANK